jgi:hypothetical protein
LPAETDAEIGNPPLNPLAYRPLHPVKKGKAFGVMDAHGPAEKDNSGNLGTGRENRTFEGADDPKRYAFFGQIEVVITGGNITVILDQYKHAFTS